MVDFLKGSGCEREADCRRLAAPALTDCVRLAAADLHAAVGRADAHQRAAGAERGRDAAAPRQLALHGDREVDAQAAVDGARLELGVVAIGKRQRDAAVAGFDVEAFAVPAVAAQASR